MVSVFKNHFQYDVENKISSYYGYDASLETATDTCMALPVNMICHALCTFV